MKVFLLSVIGQTLFNLILLVLIRKATKPRSLSRRIGIGIILVEYIAFTILFAVRSHLPREVMGAGLTLFNGYYIGLLMFLCYTLTAYVGIYLSLLKHKERRRKWYARAFFTLIPVTIILCTWGHFNTVCPRVTRHSIELPATPHTPDSLRIAFISDIHIGEIMSPKRVARLAEMVRAEAPDIVMVGGDVVDYHTSYMYLPGVKEALLSLHPDKGKIYYVLGNHEYYYHLEEKEAWIRSLGTLLKDSVALIAPDIYLIGRDDATNRYRATLSTLTDSIPPGAIRIVLDHQPKEMKQEREGGIHLALHGHTHNGQFIPFKWAVALTFERSYGLYRRDGTTYYISSGYGVAGSTFRVGTYSEIAILDVKFRKGAPGR